MQHLAIIAVVDFGVWDALRDILLLLLVALLFGAIAERLGQSLIVGYLVAGTVAGPNVLGWISKQQEIFNIAELGVALLLFVIGLEFSPRRLIELGKTSLWTGIFQILITAAATWVIAIACGFTAQTGLIIGMMIALSSTAGVLRLLTERDQLDALHGRAALGILLIQDIAVVPMMIIVSAMAGGQSFSQVAGKIGLSLSLLMLLIGAFHLVFQFIVPRVFKQRTRLRNRDLPILLAMILALGSAWGAQQLNLSPAIGSFAAGVLLGISPLATQIRADVRPLSTLLVTLFFASLGMFGDPIWLMNNWLLVFAMVAAIVVGKPLVITLLGRFFGQPWRYALATGLCLAQIGEFSFVLGTIAQAEMGGVAILSPQTFRALVSATIISLLLTPYLMAVAPRVGPWFAACVSRFRGRATLRLDEGVFQSDAAERDVTDILMIIGFGYAGQRLAEGVIDLHKERIVVVDINPEIVSIAKSYGLMGVVGDAMQKEVLENAGIHRANIIVIALPDSNTVRHLIHLIRDLAPDAYLIVRCRYHLRRRELLNAGAHEVADEEEQVGALLAECARRYLLIDSGSS